MAFDSYLFFDSGASINGESSDKDYAAKKACEIFSFSIGASNPSTIGSGTGGAGGGRVTISSLSVMKKTDSASTSLFKACALGTHVPTAELHLRKAGGGQKEYLKYIMTEVYIDSIQWSGSSGGDDQAAESVSLSFGKIQIEYYAQVAKGDTPTPMISSYDVTTNSAT